MRPNEKDGDLWRLLAVELQQIHAITIHKVAAHVSSAVSGPLEEWAKHYNDLVDAYAKQLNQDRPIPFWQAWQRFADQLALQEAQLAYTIQVHCAVGEESIRRLKASDLPRRAAQSPVGNLTQEQCIQLPPRAGVPDHLSTLVGRALALHLWCWLHHISHSEATGCWVSPLQLYIDFQMATGLTGPVYDGTTKRWTDPNQRNLASLRGHPVTQQVTWFNRILRVMLKLAGVEVQPTLTRLDSAVLGHWTNAYPLLWSRQRRDVVDSWLQKHLPGGSTRRRAAGTICLPEAARESQMVVEIPALSQGVLTFRRG